MAFPVSGIHDRLASYLAVLEARWLWTNDEVYLARMAATDAPQWVRRLIWFAILWAGGVGAVAAGACVLRVFISP